MASMADRLEKARLEKLEKIEQQKEEVAAALREHFPNAKVEDQGRFNQQRVTFSSDMLFRTCGADTTEMLKNAAPLVRAVGGVLGSFTHYFRAVQVEGHTDERDPITSARCPYRSNWHLSSARATTVVSLLEHGGVEPKKLSAVGRSEYDPIDTLAQSMSESEVRHVHEGNRRIEVLLVYDDSEEPSNHVSQ